MGFRAVTKCDPRRLADNGPAVRLFEDRMAERGVKDRCGLARTCGARRRLSAGRQKRFWHLGPNHRRHHLVGKTAEALDRPVPAAIDQDLGHARRAQFAEPRNDLLR